jgi:hypothetical protein
MKETSIRLPVTVNGEPDVELMANVVRACPATSVLRDFEAQ